MVVTLDENFRFRVSSDLKARWAGLCERKKISQQDAITALMELVLVQDEITQSMMFGQTPAAPDLIAVVLRRIDGTLAEPPSGGRKIHDLGSKDTKGRKGEVARSIRRGQGPGPSAIPDPDNSVSNHR
jgi:hypothetical protein